ncbi:MAG: hypothetical protein ABI622_01215 [Chloroflexota bacterium]
MTDLIGPDGGGTLATWVAAIATLLTWSILVGARRPFTWTQRLLAGMLTGYLALLAIREVIVPRLISPLAGDPAGHPLLLLGLLLAGMLVAGRWLPRWVGAVPVAILVGATAAFALGGAMVGSVLPQIVGLLPAPGAGPAMAAGAVISVAVASLVLLAFLHGRSQGRVVGALGAAGRWVMLGGVGAWLGYLVLSRLVLLSDRLAFLATDWLGLGR